MFLTCFVLKESRDIINDPPPGCSAGPEDEGDCKYNVYSCVMGVSQKMSRSVTKCHEVSQESISQIYDNLIIYFEYLTFLNNYLSF